MNEVSASVIGELLLDEIPYWMAGVCKVKTYGDLVKVYGENHIVVGEVETGQYLKDDGTVNLQEVADKANKIIEQEHNEL